MRTKTIVICAMYLAFIFTGVWLSQAKVPVLREEQWYVR